MAVFYKLRQDNRAISMYPGKWFAHAVNLGTVETDDVARIIERDCSVKRSDVVAVLIELGDVMKQLLGDSHRVRLKGIGSFMTSVSGKPCDTPADYDDTYINKVNINFLPDKEFRLKEAETILLK